MEPPALRPHNPLLDCVCVPQPQPSMGQKQCDWDSFFYLLLLISSRFNEGGPSVYQRANFSLWSRLRDLILSSGDSENIVWSNVSHPHRVPISFRCSSLLSFMRSCLQCPSVSPSPVSSPASTIWAGSDPCLYGLSGHRQPPSWHVQGLSSDIAFTSWKHSVPRGWLLSSPPRLFPPLCSAAPLSCSGFECRTTPGLRSVYLFLLYLPILLS